MNRLRNLTLCADDFGQSKDISEGILDLIACRRLTATSVLTEGPFWPDGAQRLKDLQDRADVGLHLNLTHAFPNTSGSRPLIHWLMTTQTGHVPRERIKERFVRQIDLFVRHFRRLPDFIDGHQHVHQFPVIRDVLLNEIQNRFSTEESFWVRNTQPPQNSSLPDALKCKTLVWLGGKNLRTKLMEADIRTNQGFLGVYGFNALTVENYRKLMRQWLKAATNKSLLMCHPANKPVQNDAIGKQRPIEFEYLKSDLLKTD